MDILIKASQFLLSLSLLIVLHELGHFLPAKWFKTRVEKFYLFFDFAPFNSLWKTQRGGTEYGIGWLPLGGYVKISGMVDESMDTEALKLPPQPWEFRSKPAWQRLIIMLGGVTVNFLLGFFIFAMLLWTFGKTYLPNTELRNGIAMDSVLIRQGLQNGDVILKVGDQTIDRLDPATFLEQVVLHDAHTVEVLRGGQTQTIQLSADVAQQLTSQKVAKSQLMAARVPFEIAKVKAGFPAEKGGLKENDHIIAFNGQPVQYFDQFGALARAQKNQTVDITVQRGRDTQIVKITLTADGLMGAAPKSIDSFYHVSREKYTLARALPGGVEMGTDFLKTQLRAFGQMFRGKISAKDNLGSVISIGDMFPPSWDWEIFWAMTASLSILLAFMNLLPIPALDGGYVMFLLFEVFTGRKVSDKFMEKAVTVGFFLLLALMVYAFGLDLWRHVFQRFF